MFVEDFHEQYLSHLRISYFSAPLTRLLVWGEIHIALGFNVQLVWGEILVKMKYFEQEELVTFHPKQ